jgi:hypothetical protein
MPNNIFLYPFTSPIILTDDIFVAYGGITGTTTSSFRQVAYELSEIAVSEYLSTLLSPTIVTGTYQLHPTKSILLGYTFVWDIKGVTIYSRNRDSSCTLNSDSSCAYLSNAEYGRVDVNLKGTCGCGNIGFDPYQIEISFEAGLPSGTVYRSNVLRALTLQAQIELNEMGLASINESVGDIGVQEFSNQGYREKRVSLLRTRLGTSAVANHAARLLSGLVRSRVGGL